MGVHNIDSMKLTFSQCNSFKPAFNLKIWRIDSESHNKILIHSKRYLNSTFIQLASYAYKNEENNKLFKKYVGLEKLGCSNFGNMQTRYLILQISWNIVG